MKKLLRTLGILVFLIISYIIFKTLSFDSKQKSYTPTKLEAIPKQSLVNLSEAVKIQTISNDNLIIDTTKFIAFHQYLEQNYPTAHQLLEKKNTNSLSLMYRWKGKQEKLDAIVLLAHMDVVPIENEALWKKAPFSGLIDNEYIWGRGTLDDKGAIIAIFESIEMLAASGFVPERDIYLCFGHDEETLGSGAKGMAEILKEEGVKAHLILDEGLLITVNMIPGIKDKAVALIGTAEKGYISVDLNISTQGGHSSTPPKENAIQELNKALYLIFENPMPSYLSEPVEDFIVTIGPEMDYPNKLAFANYKIFESIIIDTYEGSVNGAALVNNTIAPTIITSGIKENVLPSQAKATINFRLLPGTTSDMMLAHLRKTINNPNISLTSRSNTHEASKVSPIDHEAFMAIDQSIKEVFGNDVISCPNLSIAATDARFYEDISEQIYRFLPVVATDEIVESIHGNNEKISIENFEQSIRFYHQLIKNTQ